jgi:TonB-dependent starch-binding outer membrane protein SusC
MINRMFKWAIVVTIVAGGSAPAAATQFRPVSLAVNTDTNPLTRPAYLHVQNVSVSDALLVLQDRSGVSLAFSPSLLPTDHRVTCHCREYQVGEALSHLLAGVPFSYAAVGNQVLIEPKAHAESGVRATRLEPVVPYRVRAVQQAASEVADSGDIMGRIVNASNQPIGQAAVHLAGTSISTIAGSNGRFLMTNIPAGTYDLQVELIGYQTLSQEVTVRAGDQLTLTLQLVEQAISLDEIVVTGTAGAAKRRELGNSVGTVSSETLGMIGTGTVSEVLQGQTPGLQVFSNNGQVGTGSTIVLRGLNSVTQGIEPLIYVDGVRVNNPAFAANTFTGLAAAGNPGSEGAQTSPKPLDAINPNDIARVEVIRGAAATTLYGTEAAGGVIQIFTKRGQASQAPTWSIETKLGSRFQTSNGLGPVVGQDPDYLGLKPWLERGAVHGLTGSVTGGTDQLRYFLSGMYDYEEGVLPNNNSRRTGVRGNFGFRPHESLLVDVNMAYANRASEFVESGDNTYGFILNVFRGTQDYTGDHGDGILFDIDNESSEDRFVGGVTLSHALGDINNRVTVGLDYTNAFNNQTIPFGFPLVPAGLREVNRWTNRVLSLDYTGTWNHAFRETISSTFSWGGQIFQNYDHAQFGTADGFGGPGEKTLRSGAITRADETQLSVVNAGFFLQEVLGYRNRLFLTVGGRADGNSAFGQDLGLQVYPKVSGSWVVSEEAFWPDWIQVMRLRAAVGESGKAPGVFDAVRTWTPIAGYDGQPGVTPATVGNAELGPERTRETELGFESSVLNDRLSGEFTWYHAVTRDALFHVPAPPSEGFLSSPLRNVGEIENKGIELSVTGVPVETGNLHWEVTGSYSTNESLVTDLGGSAPFNVGFAFLNQWIREGYPVVSSFGTIVTNPDEIADPIYEADVYQGPIYPTHQYSLATTLSLGRRISLYVMGEGTGGNIAINNMARQGVNRGLWPECYERDLSQETAIWRARCQNNPQLSVWTRAADVFYLRTISLSYQLPSWLVPGAASSSLMVSGQNLWKSQKHIGLDPSLNRGGRYSVAPARYEYYQLPPSQALILKLRATF